MAVALYAWGMVADVITQSQKVNVMFIFVLVFAYLAADRISEQRLSGRAGSPADSAQ
jgi:hypothetical protein